METDPTIKSKKAAPPHDGEALVQSRFVRHVRQFGEVWVASQDGMAAIGATRKDAISGLAACLKCKTTVQIIHTWATFKGGSELVPEHVEKLTTKTLAPFRWPNAEAIHGEKGATK